MVRAEERLDVFGVELLRPLREADEVAEDNRDDLALAASRGHQAIFARSPSPRSMKNVAPTDR